ncbi:MAG: malto-oligosyltrehalose synthase [Salinarimonas sp.]|nr:malto-oligosyltrehalose synthase [Salinarimonas sp.]
MIPRATYRLQFNAGFTFADAQAIVPYLAGLGISHVYASPILSSRSGSSHGYDGVDPTRVDEELGGEPGLRALVAELRAHGMGLIADIVPNHMAVGGAENAWWLDVLENGKASPYAAFFDIDWDTADPALRGKVLAPFLGEPYGAVLEAGDLALVFDAALESFAIAYHHHRFPIRPEDYPAILRAGGEEFEALAERFEAADGRAGFIEACRVTASMGDRLDAVLEAHRDPHILHELLERQHFRLAWWRVAGDMINWRRFFDITELAGLRVEEPRVFDMIHGTILRLYREGLVDGVRIDHIDGLRDPAGYCHRLRERLDELTPLRPEEAVHERAWLIVEKILGRDETLPRDWDCHGTTGYEFMDRAGAVLHDPRAADVLSELWSEVSGRYPDFESEEADARNELLVRDFSGQLEACACAFHAMTQAELETRDITLASLRRALTALIVAFPVYRTYATEGAAPGSDAPHLAEAVAAAREMSAPGEAGIVDLIAGWLSGIGGADPQARGEAVARFQQLTAPIAAKAVEDTAFYRYGRLLSRNDVGFDVTALAVGVDDFHAASVQAAAHYPDGMVTTATHDHKRGEDVRARLAVISEDPGSWGEAVAEWFERNRRIATEMIDPADEYTLYQMMAGAWPLDLPPDDAQGLAAFRDRLAGWQEKALREAKLRSSWRAPDGEYEGACRAFLETIIDPDRSLPFLEAMHGYVQQIAPAGALNGLTQAFLRNLAPGVPDLYQGCEFWDFSLVDPDNRRPVDYAARIKALGEGAALPALMPHWRDGRIKQALIARLLNLRAEAPARFARGDHVPLEVAGARAGNVIAFARRFSSSLLIAVAPRCTSAAIEPGGAPLPDPQWWQDTRILIPPDMIGTPMRDGWGDGAEVALDGEIALSELLADLPFGLKLSA